MNTFRIGVIGDSLRLPPYESIATAAQLGADGISFYAASPAFLSAEPDAIRLRCADAGLEIPSLIGELGGHGWQNENENRVKIPRLKEMVLQASRLATKIITSHIGVIPESPACPRYAVMQAACRELGHFAADHGMCFGIETGPEPAERLLAFLAELDTPGIGVNLDPANLVMVLNADPTAAVRTLKGHIVHTHAKDGVHYRACNPERVYNAFAEGGFDQLVAETGQLFAETPLGQGQVDWDNYLQALRTIGFNGFLTIEREEVGTNPILDIANAIGFLRTAQT
jgi:sugar phosphate isomerase/epimerase